MTQTAESLPCASEVASGGECQGSRVAQNVHSGDILLHEIVKLLQIRNISVIIGNVCFLSSLYRSYSGHYCGY